MPSRNPLARVLRPAAVAASLAIVSLVAVAAPGAPRTRAVDRPISVSGTVKNLNRDVEVAVDPLTGNGLAVWNRSKRRQSFGEVWGAEIVRQGDGTYLADKPFRISNSRPAQRPTVEFLPGFGLYMILWDSGFRDPEKTSKDAHILARLYEPVAGSARGSEPGDLLPETPMTSGPGINLAPGLAYHGLLGDIFEELFYGWLEAGVDSAGRRAPPKKSVRKKRRAHVFKSSKAILQGNMASANEDNVKSGSFKGSAIYGSDYGSQQVVRLADRICWLRALETDDSPSQVRFGVGCFSPATLEGTFTVVGDPIPGDPDEMFGTLRHDGDESIRAVTSAGAFDVDAASETATPVAFSLNPLAVVGSFFGGTVPNRTDDRRAAGEGFVYIQPRKGLFKYSTLARNGDLKGPGARLWKLKRNRFLDMDVRRADDAVLVAWTEAKNRRGTKATIKLGWFVPE